MNSKQNNKSGINLLVNEIKGESQIQGAWRFYNNENVKIDDLNNPILKEGCEQINKECKEYCLIAYDWSHIDFRNHHAKKDCIETRRSKKEAKSKGYDFQGSLAINDVTGKPITPLLMNLKTKDKVYSTYDSNIDINLKHLEELTIRSQYTNENLDIKKQIVDIVDREADSVEFLRSYHKDKRLYLVRAKDQSTLIFNNEKMQQKQLAKSMPKGKMVKTIQYEKEDVKIYVNECDVTITRDACKTIIDKETQKRYMKRIPGNAIKTRFVVVKLINDKQDIVATWMLLTNVPKKVNSKTIATWYYYRWNIETYFKLLKTSGFNLEKWKQEKAIALFKRLLIVSYVCVLVWKIQHSKQKQMEQLRKFLTKLGGRLISRNKQATASSLLAGIWVFLTMMDVLSLYDLDELFTHKKNLNAFLGVDW